MPWSALLRGLRKGCGQATLRDQCFAEARKRLVAECPIRGQDVTIDKQDISA